jgi:GT2 family glycosyltransferase
MVPEKIAAVIIGRNEGPRLISCLESIQSNTELAVYVDSGSTDGSERTAVRLGAHVVNLSTDIPFTAARARNQGFATVRTLRPNIQFVQFIDGDCEMDAGWLKAAVDFMESRGDVALVCGRRRERYPSASVYNRLCDIEWGMPAGQTSACGGDFLARVEAFEAVGGFNPNLIAGEEPEMCLRLREKRWNIWRLDAEMTRHDAAMTRFGQWWARAVRSGYGMTEVARLHWKSSTGIWKKELARALFWGALLPVVIGLAAFVHPFAFAAVSIYPFQVCKIAVARGPKFRDSWIYGLFITVGKFAEIQGIVKFYWRRACRQTIQLIEYK